MSQKELVNFQRLEEFPSFVSCIRSFGKSIIPPLLTSSRVHELRQLRAAAISKETAILKRKRDNLKEIKNDPALGILPENDHQFSVPESCALWYPSYLDNQDVSVAISKFPTSGIYSSVHTDAIVCSNIVGNNHVYNSNIAKDILIDSAADCIECSHSNVSLECSMCLAELNRNFCSKRFPADLSPEVPCRTFSLLQHNDVVEREFTTLEGAESPPIAISNQKNILPDTDSESNTTCMTQSTDLDKYMELSCEFNSPDNSSALWDSKTTSQQCTLSRSDDASSETIVNTENELTPCASTMAELTDNIEDEFSNAEEVAGASENKEVSTGSMKRAHSVDSYMKILQNCGRNQNVKKSQSEPFNTSKDYADMKDKTTVASKTNLLIKEDSKESEEAKDVPEKDYGAQENVDFSKNHENDAEPEANKNNSFNKRHVRQNSYTLDYPSSALVLAHADCACNFDAKCIPPHCSKLKDATEVTCHSAFVKEKVANSTSPSEMKLLPILNSDKPLKEVNLAKEEISPAVVDIYPKVKEDNCEKSDCDNIKTSVNTCDSKLDAKGYLSKSFLENLNLSNQAKHQEYIQRICEELKINHEQRVKELRDEQNRQWLKLEEEFQEQEKFLYEKLRLALESSRGLSSTNESNLAKSNRNSHNEEEMPEEKSVLQNEQLPISNSSGSLSDQIPTSDSSSSTQTSTLSIPTKCSPSSLSPPEIPVLPENALVPSKECCVTSDKNSSIPSEDEFKTSISNPHVINNEIPLCISSQSMSDINGQSHPVSFVPHYDSLPKYPSAIAVPIYNDCDNIATCFCDNTFELCRCCTPFNGCLEDNSNSLSSREQFSTSFTNDVTSKKLSPSSGMQMKSVDSTSFGSSEINVTNLSEKLDDCISSAESDRLTSTENRDLLNIKKDDKRNSFPWPIVGKSNLPIDNLVSLCAKTSKNGACNSLNSTSKDRVNSTLMKKLKKLPAFVKGYLTRRLLNTEYVQNLIKTFKDTALLMSKMGDDFPAEEDSLSRDLDFRRQLIVLLMTTYENFYDTFFTISTKERMSIIADSRRYRLKRKNISNEHEPDLPLNSKALEPSASKTHKLSSATLKVLERKKRPIDNRTYNVEDLRKSRSRSVLDMKTYTIDDLPSFSGRAQSSMSSRSVSIPPPSSVYKNSVGLKRKTASAKSSGSQKCVHQKWVP